MVTAPAPPSSGCVWITGASTGIGREVALRFARAGWTVAMTARRRELLDDLAATPALAGRLVAYPCDVTDPAAMAGVVGRIEAECGPVRIALLNAGTYAFERMEEMEAGRFRSVIDTNLMGVVHGLVPLLTAMRTRRSGQIAIVASVAGYLGLPGSLAYGASKAALINLAEALAMEATPWGIRVQVINPGFVETPLTASNRFPMPFLMPVGRAADHILRGLSSSRFEIAFPWPMVALLKVVRRLPYRLSFALLSRLTAKG